VPVNRQQINTASTRFHGECACCPHVDDLLFVYTPLKRKTPWCTLAGTVPDAVPTLIGWAASVGSIIGGKAWILYAVLFLWQFPHFMAIAWIYREDYARAGNFVLAAQKRAQIHGMANKRALVCSY
jgi:heme O synthase-like polyprenyltransferase